MIPVNINLLLIICTFFRTGGQNIATILAEYLPDVLRNELDSCIGYNTEDPLKLQVDFK